MKRWWCTCTRRVAYIGIILVTGCGDPGENPSVSSPAPSSPPAVTPHSPPSSPAVTPPSPSPEISAPQRTLSRENTSIGDSASDRGTATIAEATSGRGSSRESTAPSLSVGNMATDPGNGVDGKRIVNGETANDGSTADTTGGTGPTNGINGISGENENVVVDPEAMRLLDDMFRVYRQAKEYADRGIVRVTGIYADGEPFSMEIPMVTVVVKPNQLRLETYTTTVVSDGTEMIAFITDYPGQVMRRAAPERMTPGELFVDPILAEALSQGAIFRGELGFTQSVAWLPPPLLMLLDDDPGRTLLDEATAIETLPPMILESTDRTEIDGTTENTTDEDRLKNPGDPENVKDKETAENAEKTKSSSGAFCHQVKITRRDGAMILRMDAKTHLLRQMDFPVGDYGQIRQMVIRADFTGAALVRPDSPTLFAWELPDEISVSGKFQPPREPAADVIGLSVPDFSFNLPSGEKVDRERCADRPLLVTFWETQAPDSLDLLDVYGGLAQKYRDQIRILAVNVDPMSVTQEAVDVKWRIPEELSRSGTLYAVRDTDLTDPVAVRFGLRTIPTTFFVGTDGKIQDLMIGIPLKEKDPVENTPDAGKNIGTDTTNPENTALSGNTGVLDGMSDPGDTVEVDLAGLESRVELLLAGNELGTMRQSEIAARREELVRNFTEFEQRYATWLETWIADGRYRFTDSLMNDLSDVAGPGTGAEPGI
ncbi:MAG: hypothetical protein Q4C47_03870 [Planctomycetia bacterium]|nr:hypothetical protein [Planctomycetia bacterium]